MFEKQDLSVIDWLLYTVLMVIPFVNIIVWIIVLSSPRANKTLKNYILAQFVLMALGLIIILMLFGLFMSIPFDLPA